MRTTRFTSILGLFVACIVGLWTATTRSAAADEPLSTTFVDWRQHPAIAYTSRSTSDPIAELSRRLDSGTVRLTREGPSGYLRSLLEALNVPISSQVAVFAKDSVQGRRIEANNPRTLFFNDSVAVGWVRGGFIELASQDPQQGTIFYTGDVTLLGELRLTRTDGCLTCHHSYNTVGVPGMLVKSAGHTNVDQRLAFAERWGGWYVTGQSGTQAHLGNVPLERVFFAPPTAASLNWSSFGDKFDASGYLSSHSDIVALLVFEHQMHMMNLLTRIGWEARVADYRARAGGAAFSAEADAATVPLVEAAGELVDYMFFVDEARVSGRIRGSTDFADRFASQGPRDGKGRSLRDLDLERRLMKYPCSYMIYSRQFAELPSAARDAIYRRMWTILSGADKKPKYRHLSSADRRAVVEILRATKPDLPEYFSSPVR